jgi:hypothetical protein
MRDYVLAQSFIGNVRFEYSLVRFDADNPFGRTDMGTAIQMATLTVIDAMRKQGLDARQYRIELLFGRVAE